ncbi:hypothetical protein ACOSQ3_021870 [Xanthoceras sorbifolium]
MKNFVMPFCDSYKCAKMHQFPFESSTIRTFNPLELVFSDVWGPAPISSSQGYKYFVNFINFHTRYTWIYPLREKSEVISVFKLFKTAAELLFDRKLKCFQSDWGGEFRPIASFLATHGIVFRHPCTYTHQQNGLPERKYRHVVETGLALLSYAKMPLSFWWEAFDTATYLINRLPTPTLKHKCPFECVHHHKPNFKFLKVFGSSCFPYLRFYNKHKFEFHSSKCVFIGYSRDHKGYQCLHPSRRIYVSRHVQFNKFKFPFCNLFSPNLNSAVSSSSAQLPLDFTPCVSISKSAANLYTPYNYASSPAPLECSSLAPTEPNIATHSAPTEPNIATHPAPIHSATINMHPMLTRSKCGISKPKSFSAVSSCSNTAEEPKNVKCALLDKNWAAAMKAEFDAVQANKTWSLVPYQSSMNVVGNKWVFRVKYIQDGSLQKYKARLVAKGFHQTPGLDFLETFWSGCQSIYYKSCLGPSCQLSFGYPID